MPHHGRRGRRARAPSASPRKRPDSRHPRFGEPPSPSSWRHPASCPSFGRVSSVHPRRTAVLELTLVHAIGEREPLVALVLAQLVQAFLAAVRRDLLAAEFLESAPAAQPNLWFDSQRL